MLYILPINAEIPWLGKMSELRCLSIDQGIQHYPKGISPASYYTTKNGPPAVTTISVESLQVDCQKIARLAKGLPNKQDNLVSEFAFLFFLIPALKFLISMYPKDSK